MDKQTFHMDMFDFCSDSNDISNFDTSSDEINCVITFFVSFIGRNMSHVKFLMHSYY